MGKGGLIAMTAALATLAGCSTPDQAADAPAPVALEIAEQTQPIGTRMPQDGDLCRAGENQNLVGKPKEEIPVPVDVINRRVVCTTCAITEDYSPYRLNIFFNQETGIVEQVRCG